MIRRCSENDFEAIHQIINEAAGAYLGAIPEDRLRDPYMPEEELRAEMEAGVEFYGLEGDDGLVGVMGLQTVRDCALIRHAYVRTACQGRGIGSRLLCYLMAETDRPLLVGTWAAAEWARAFYRKHGFREVGAASKDLLLRQYWEIPNRQIETSVVLADARWWARHETHAAEEAAWAVIRSLNDAWTQGRATQAARYFHPRMVAFTAADDRRLRGAEECAAGWEAFARQATIHAWREIDPRVQVFGGCAVVTYYYELDCSFGDDRTTLTGRDMLTLVQTTRGWQVVADHFSSRVDGEAAR